MTNARLENYAITLLSLPEICLELDDEMFLLTLYCCRLDAMKISWLYSFSEVNMSTSDLSTYLRGNTGSRGILGVWM